MKSEVVHFTIQGDFIANLARDFALEGRWLDGVKLLTDSLIGLTTDQAISIVRGINDFSGDSNKGVDIIPASAEIIAEMNDAFDYQYKDLFKYNGKIWKPYAKVFGWGEPDAVWSMTDKGKGYFRGFDYSTTTYSKRRDRRSLFYAHDQYNDLVWKLSNDKIILCSEVKNAIPLWIDIQIPLENWIPRNLDSLYQYGYCAEEDYDLTPVDTIDDLSDGDFSNDLDKTRESRVAEVLANMQQKSKELSEEEIAQKVKEQAGDNTFRLDLFYYKDGEQIPYTEVPFVMVPYAPFVRWCLRLAYKESLTKPLPEWNAVSPYGMKMAFDDPNHTDWCLAVGVPLENVYDRDGFANVVMSSAYDKKAKIVEEYTGHTFTVLANPKNVDYVYGNVVHPKPNAKVSKEHIAIVSNGSQDYEFAMRSSKCLICETGGKLSHLATVGRESGCLVLMVPNALKRFPEGSTITVDFESGIIRHNVL